MKTIYTFLSILGGISLISISSFSCPNIQGIWSCSDGSEPQVINVLSGKEGYFLEMYDANLESNDKTTFKLDGKKQTLKDGHYTAFCDARNIIISGAHYDKSETEADALKIKFRYALIQPDVISVQVLESNLPELADPKAEPMICKKTSPLK